MPTDNTSKVREVREAQAKSSSSSDKALRNLTGDPSPVAHNDSVMQLARRTSQEVLRPKNPENMEKQEIGKPNIKELNKRLNNLSNPNWKQSSTHQDVGSSFDNPIDLTDNKKAKGPSTSERENALDTFIHEKKEDLNEPLEKIKEWVGNGHSKRAKERIKIFREKSNDGFKALSYWMNERFKLDESWAPAKKIVDSIHHIKWE